MRSEDGIARLLWITLLQSLPWSVGLAGSLTYGSAPYPGWLWHWLWVSYLILLAGELRAWWWPYLVRPDSQRAERYRRMFGHTHAFLPSRNGLVPNTLHVALHSATALTVGLLTFLHFSGHAR
ncbi:hypothetical protein [Cognatilysobacter lacus]|uniref:Uncharacterized protein n=1 Tax=Cognatilysobacter lacus TaxID=1643323 RepID=A0A5D8Z715_9GAMM|nr:hypothetical protein [Lysobacter lacus]TZF90715.1 hypothetical protein FW784_04230 [Lysobacter lacus]